MIQMCVFTMVMVSVAMSVGGRGGERETHEQRQQAPWRHRVAAAFFSFLFKTKKRLTFFGTDY